MHDTTTSAATAISCCSVVCCYTAVAVAAACCCSSPCVGWQNLLLWFIASDSFYISLFSHDILSMYPLAVLPHLQRRFLLIVRIYHISSVITCMRGAKAGVSSTRRSPPCTATLDTVVLRNKISVWIAKITANIIMFVDKASVHAGRLLICCPWSVRLRYLLLGQLGWAFDFSFNWSHTDLYRY